MSEQQKEIKKNNKNRNPEKELSPKQHGLKKGDAAVNEDHSWTWRSTTNSTGGKNPTFHICLEKKDTLNIYYWQHNTFMLKKTYYRPFLQWW